MRPIEIRHLRYFIAVAEEGHFSRAAERLGIAQPPLSQQIQQLEDRIGCKLFDRRPTVRLTLAGAALLPIAQRLIDDLRSGRAKVAKIGRGEAGLLRIGMAGSVVATSAVEQLRTLRARWPDVAIQVIETPSAQQPQALKRGQIDVGIARQPPEEDGVISTTVMDEPFLAALPPDHPAADSGVIDLRVLRDTPLVLFPASAAPALHAKLMGMFGSAGLSVESAQEAQEWLTIVGLVAAGIGASVVPASFAKLQWGQVRYVELMGVTATSRVAVLSSPDPPPLVSRLLQLVALSSAGSS